MTDAITLRDVTKNYPGFSLHIPHFAVEQGYITGFIGENGAGKTTTLRMLMDILRPDSGEIRVLGLDPATEPEALKQQVGYVDSLAYFNPSIKAGLAKHMVAPFYRDWDEDLYQGYLRRFQLREDKKLKEMSSGQNKLFSLTMALSHRPRLLILDEPTSNLDPVIRNDILDILAELMQSGEITVFYSTHITSDLDKTADFVAYLREGQLLLHEEKDRMLEEFRLVKGDRALLQSAEDLLIGARSTDVGFTALTRRTGELLSRLGDRVALEKPNLEDIMIYTAKGGARHA